MFRRVIVSLYIITTLALMNVMVVSTAHATQHENTIRATPTTSQVYIDKHVIPLEGYNINGSNYFKLRDLAQHLSGTSKQFSVGWNGKSNTIQLTTGSPYTGRKSVAGSATSKTGAQKAVTSNSSIVINNQEVTLSAYNIHNNTYFKLRDLGEHLQFPVIYRPVDESIQIMTAVEVNVQQYSNRQFNLRTDDYYYGNWRSPANRALFQSGHHLYILENDWEAGELHIYKISDNKNRVVVKTELAQFGGFHAGEDGHYYVIYGQDNMEESATKPVYRIVKYDQDWRKVASLDISDVYVTRPFHAGNVSFDSSNDKLIVHMTRQRYASPSDGLHHQSNITIEVNMNTMQLLRKSGDFPENHVSHSFATYVRYDGDHVVYADHGDAYPRAHILQVEDTVNDKMYSYTFAHPLGGNTGDNYTGIYLGGLEVGKSNYVVASTYNKEYMTEENSQNVRIDYINKDYSFDFSGHELWLTHYESKDNVSIKQIHIVKIDDQTFAVLWDESRGRDMPNKLMYAVINDSGSILQEPKELLGVPAPGNVIPLVDGRNIMWYHFDYRDYRNVVANPVELYTLTIPDFGDKVHEQKITYLDPKEDRADEINHALARLGYEVEDYLDEDRSRSYSLYNPMSYASFHFTIFNDLYRISTGLAAHSGHTFDKDVHSIAAELDVVKKAIETDLQLQMPDFRDQIINRIVSSYQGLRLMEDVVTFDLNLNGVTIEAEFYVFYFLSHDEPLYTLTIDYYVDALKQKYNK